MSEPKKAYHHGDLKAALLQAALEELERCGKEDLSLRAIAEKIGVSKMAPYRHFPEKKDLLAALCAQGLGQLAQRIQSAVESTEDSRELLERMALAYLNFSFETPQLFRLVFSSQGLSVADPQAQAEGQAAYRWLTFGVKKCRETSGLWNDRPLEAAVVVVWSYIHGLAQLILEGFIPPEIIHSELRSWILSRAL